MACEQLGEVTPSKEFILDNTVDLNKYNPLYIENNIRYYGWL